MADKNWQKVRETFDSALRQKPEERQNFVNGACGEDKALLAEVNRFYPRTTALKVLWKRPLSRESIPLSGQRLTNAPGPTF